MTKLLYDIRPLKTPPIDFEFLKSTIARDTRRNFV